MSQPATEVDKTKQTAPETNGLGVPSMGENQHMSNGTAVAEVVKMDQAKIDGTSVAEEQLEENSIHPTVPSLSAEHTDIKLDKDVSNADVKINSQTAAIQPLQDAAQALGGSVTGPVSHKLGEADVEVITPKDTSGVGVFPNPFEVGDLANPEKNGKPLHKLFIKKLGDLLYGIPPKILGGTKQINPEPQKVLEPKTT